MGVVRSVCSLHIACGVFSVFNVCSGLLCIVKINVCIMFSLNYVYNVTSIQHVCTPYMLYVVCGAVRCP